MRKSAKFNNELLPLARHLRQLTQAQLIKKLNNNISQGTLSKIEHGLLEPSSEQVRLLAKILNVRNNFFYNSFPIFDFSHSYYRTQKSISVTNEKLIEARARLYRMHIQLLLESVEMEPELEPIYNFSSELFEISNIDYVEAVAALRRIWNIPRGPVHNITAIVERAGIIVIPMDFGTMKMDGFCQHAIDQVPPLIFINKHLSIDRYRFSLLHELGHLLMHRIPNDLQEEQANCFASEFLIPDSSAKDIFEGRLSLNRLMELKRYWGVSIQALLYKAKMMGKISESGYRYYQIELSKRGYRKNEPVLLDNFKEKSATLKELIRVHLEDLEYSEQELEQMLSLYSDDLDMLYGIKKIHSKPKLKLVINH